VRRGYEILADDVLITTNGDRHNTAPWGLAGGQDGSFSSYILYRDGEEIRLPAASNITCRKGDRFVIEIPGGGGYGDPGKRAPDAIAADIRCGRVSPASD
jgi:N-methylhydantoinase B/oxoprolinase/acetone carboxylase alpha subunit